MVSREVLIRKVERLESDLLKITTKIPSSDISYKDAFLTEKRKIKAMVKSGFLPTIQSFNMDIHDLKRRIEVLNEKALKDNVYKQQEFEKELQDFWMFLKFEFGSFPLKYGSYEENQSYKILFSTIETYIKELSLSVYSARCWAEQHLKEDWDELYRAAQIYFMIDLNVDDLAGIQTNKEVHSLLDLVRKVQIIVDMILLEEDVVFQKKLYLFIKTN